MSRYSHTLKLHMRVERIEKINAKNHKIFSIFLFYVFGFKIIKTYLWFLWDRSTDTVFGFARDNIDSITFSFRMVYPISKQQNIFKLWKYKRKVNIYFLPNPYKENPYPRMQQLTSTYRKKNRNFEWSLSCWTSFYMNYNLILLKPLKCIFPIRFLI